ncbi:hypothetical protein LCGC14_1996400, partial [marine sediment metagenome]
MPIQLSADALIERGLDAPEADALLAQAADADASSPTEAWAQISLRVLKPEHPPDVHEYVHSAVFADWDRAAGPPPAWIPQQIDSTNIASLMRAVGKADYDSLYQWSIAEPGAFWGTMIERLGVVFAEPYSCALDLADGPEHPRWLPGAKLNIVDSCFNAPSDSPAIVFQQGGGPLRSISVAELRALVFRVANALV